MLNKNIIISHFLFIMLLFFIVGCQQKKPQAVTQILQVLLIRETHQLLYCQQNMQWTDIINLPV